MSNQDKDLIVSIGKRIVEAAKALGYHLKVDTSPVPVCRECNAPIHPDYEFCSDACGLEYWKKLKDQRDKTSGQRICGYPGCSKPCYVEPSWRKHDYCGKKHADGHRALQDRRRKQCWQEKPHNSSHHWSTNTQLGQNSSWSCSSKSVTRPIKFYDQDDPYYEFTNFYSAPIELDRKTWPTTEHYFQAQKFVGTPYEEQIRHFSQPWEVFDFTKDPRVSRWRRNDWKRIRKDVMYKALLAKFTQHNYLRKLLLGTGERTLIEHSPYDSYWGDGGDGTGKNHLGKLLMQLRHELQEVTRENLQHSTLSGQWWEQSGSTPLTSEHGGCIPGDHLLRRPPQEQSSHLDDPAMNYQLSNAGDNTTGKDPPGHIPEPASHQSTGIRAECTTQQLFDGSQQQPHQPGSDMFSTTVDELHPSTATVQPGYGLLSLVTTASSNSQEEDSDFTEVAVPLDQQCKLMGCTRPKFVESDGRVHDFCGRTHARQHAMQQQGPTPVPEGMRCKTPGCPRPRRMMDNGTGYYDYCGLSCRDQGQRPSGSLALSEGGTCSLPGCTRPKYVDPANNRTHNFCGRTHAFLAQEQGITLDNVGIRVAAAGSQEFTAVSGKFQRAWAKGSCPPVSFIFIINNRQLQQRWSAYRQKLSDQTMEEHYHGTVLLCNITTNNSMCNKEECGICGISRTGFDQRCIRKNISFQRFGHGFYVAPNSSKCHDYTQGNHGYRAMLLCDVCPGRKYPMTRNDEKLQGPPAGYDSIHGQGGPGSVLNYDEIVVYNPDCVLPRYVIVYQKDGTHKIAQSTIKSNTSTAQSVRLSSRKRSANIGSIVHPSLAPSSGYHKSASTSMSKSLPRTVHALATPMVSRKTYRRPLPADPPTPSSSSFASTGRRYTNQSSVNYDILTRRKY